MRIWLWLTTSCEVGWRRHTRFLLLGWLGAIAVCLAAVWLGDGLYYFLDFRWSGNPFSGLMTLASGFCFVACGWGLLVAARRAMRSAGQAREAAGWTIAGVGCVWLAFDEVAQVHELAARLLEHAGVPHLFGVLDLDVYIFAAYMAGLVLVLAMLWPTRRPLEPVMLPLLVAIACFAFSELADQMPWNEMDHDSRRWVGTLEEVIKTLGSWTLAMCGLLCADEATRPRAGARESTAADGS